ncbi:MAG: hypothetical protein KKE23_03485 [Nanoarchaeota archaeon]|nr:hypothetical protein [Nanoarchaeota archaeon]
MAKPKRGDKLQLGRVNEGRLDMALEYIEHEIRKLENRKDELEQMSERLIAKQDLLERQRDYAALR